MIEEKKLTDWNGEIKMPENVSLDIDTLRRKIDQAIGGSYQLEDGRSFWLDTVAVREILNRAMPVIEAWAFLIGRSDS